MTFPAFSNELLRWQNRFHDDPLCGHWDLVHVDATAIAYDPRGLFFAAASSTGKVIFDALL
jgi:hypothetical protein